MLGALELSVVPGGCGYELLSRGTGNGIRDFVSHLEACPFEVAQIPTVSWCGQFPVLSFPFNLWTPQPFLFSIIGHPDPILPFSRERFSSWPALQISNLALLDPP